MPPRIPFRECAKSAARGAGSVALARQVGLQRHDRDVSLDGREHRLEVVEAGVDAQLVAQPVEPLPVQIAQPDHVGARVVAIRARGVSAPLPQPSSAAR